MAIQNQQSEDGTANVNYQKRLMAQELSERIERLLNKWESGDDPPTSRELRRCTEKWFADNGRRNIFLALIDRAERYKNGYPYRIGRGEVAMLKIDVITSKVFRHIYIGQLFDDFHEQFREYHEIVTTLAWMMGKTDDKPTFVRLKTLSEAFGRTE